MRSFLKAMSVGVLAFGVQPAVASTAARALLADDLALTNATCGCSARADCTCKKGQCKCAKCGNSAHSQLVAPLRGEQTKATLPQNARYDATAGVFI